ncbi:BRO family protein [Rhodococcoides kyotonense]|uniref:Phage antirepressor protein KilAC domain-containing protein n=1 Tax=Rhodococcoides kyotonense TaxID=398843 RepID=A0A239FTX3_9NOCA|nr:phage antirepressor [Rhodococcus kyotonensis]SNS59602.1 Phage antirepressor protein KilAC domain-containing protein [Rhodococcus kyotonensis]
MTTLAPFQYAGHTLRTVIVDDEPWFVLGDLCKVLGLTRGASQIAERLDEGVRQTYPLQTTGGRQNVTIVNEPGMYEVVIRSDKPDAVAFRRWITAEVLPTIRKTGSYNTAPALSGPELLAHAVIEAQAMIAAKDERIAELEPKAHVADKILDADGDYSVRDAAQALTRAGIKVGATRLFNDLEHRHWIARAKGDGRYRVLQAAIESGHMSVIPTSHYHPKTGVLVLDPPQPRVTPKGLQKLLDEYGAANAAPQQLQMETGL